MAAMAQLRFSPLTHRDHLLPRGGGGGNPNFLIQPSSPLLLPSNISSFSSSPSPSVNLSLTLFNSKPLNPNSVASVKALSVDTTGNGDGFGSIGNSGGGGGNGGNGNGGDGSKNPGRDDGDGNDNGGESNDGSSTGLGLLGLLLSGWRSRVAADPQFGFKVLMEEIVGVSSCVLGDMASRPNFGLNELDFVFSTLVVGSILNFTLMYLLAPTMGSASNHLPGIFASCPKSHMFEPGAYSVLDRFGTFVYKGTVFAAVGFAAGLVGTAISNGLIKMRKKMDPNFETPNKAPPTLLNSMTWATHMGLSSNFRYQTLNGVEYLLEKGLPPFGFKASVFVLRCMNNVLGGVSFVTLARITGSQKVDGKKEEVSIKEESEGSVEEKVKLLETSDSSEPTSK